MINGYKTILGAAIALAPIVANWFGFDLSPAFGEQFSSIAMDLITIGGALFAIYGRLVAETPGWLVKK